MSRPAGLLLYTPEDAARNQWFITQLCQNAESEGLSLRLCLVAGGDPRIPFRQQPDFLINRSRISSYSSFARDHGIPCFNSAAVTAITNDKFLTYEFFCETHGIPMAKTQQIRKNDPLPALHYPVIAKPADGHGGAGVSLIRDEAALMQYRADFDAAHPSPARPFLVQEPVVFGWDVRIYVMFGEICAAVLRTSETDIRSNFSLGGHAELIEPDADMRALVEAVQRILPLDFAGVDLLRRQDGSYLLGEIEDAVGCRMLYQLTGKDPAKDFIAGIAQKLSGMLS
ncbi:MAG: ATP-grasp domain-containing protein [Oscillospiraceae bacterium]|nr:ATP-grasp domain-containing protein [Oscillospiraceae bacterium]